jgi:hypothetical protein
LVLPFYGFEIGVQTSPSWDAALGVIRLPLQLSFGLDRRLRFFAGPALTIGNPSLLLAGVTRVYEASGGLIASAGLTWAPFDFKVGSMTWRLVGQITYDRYVAADSMIADAGSDSIARVHAGVFVETRLPL